MTSSQTAPERREPAGSEPVLCDLLSDILGVDAVMPDSHFFDDLGADSLVMAHFCARVRKLGDLPAVSMRDVYRNPTVARLAAALDTTPAHDGPSAEEPDEPARTGRSEYLLCGLLQGLALVAVAGLSGLAVARGYVWIATGTDVVDVYLRSMVVGSVLFGCLGALPVLVKWLLVGRWRAGRIRVWSLAYVRFWMVAFLLRTSPLRRLAGTPLYPLYLRALGARIGRGTAILSDQIPVCTDLLTVGDGAVIRHGARFGCYRARSGWITTGPVTVGANTLVGEQAVLDIDTSLGESAQLAYVSSLHSGQHVPAGEHRHGSPGRPTDVDYRMVGPARCGTVRRAWYGVLRLLALLVVQLPVTLGGGVLLVGRLMHVTGHPDTDRLDLSNPALYGDALVMSALVLVGAVLAGLLVLVSVPRLLNLLLVPDAVYPLYGIHYAAHRVIARLTNLPFFTHLFGDSAAIVNYLRVTGYDLNPVQQTGSNFGLETRHENPYLTSVGSGTMAADGLTSMNADFTSTSFHLSRVAIGAHSFIGNYVAYPAGARTGDNCLLATKVMVPIDGEAREGVGLLGSPSFEIPRSVQRDRRFDALRTGPEFRRRLAAKTRHNAVTMALFLLSWWIYGFIAAVVILAAADLHTVLGPLAASLAGVTVLLLGLTHFVLVERLAGGFRALRPRYCSIYQPYFWWHERYWKLSIQPAILDGTPFKTVAWRLLGVRIGARVLDDGCTVMEKTLVSIGDDCALNAGSVIQPHSQEDGSFKSDRISIGAGCTVGVGALVHYGVTMGDRAELAPDSFLMKGEEVSPQAQWGGNPARMYTTAGGTTS